MNNKSLLQSVLEEIDYETMEYVRNPPLKPSCLGVSCDDVGEMFSNVMDYAIDSYYDDELHILAESFRSMIVSNTFCYFPEVGYVS